MITYLHGNRRSETTCSLAFNANIIQRYKHIFAIIHFSLLIHNTTDNTCTVVDEQKLQKDVFPQENWVLVLENCYIQYKSMNSLIHTMKELKYWKMNYPSDRWAIFAGANHDFDHALRRTKMSWRSRRTWGFEIACNCRNNNKWLINET